MPRLDRHGFALVLAWFGGVILVIVRGSTVTIGEHWAAAAGPSVMPFSSAVASQHLPLVLKVWSPDEAAGQALVISELMYDPLGSEPGEEWVEIYNPGERVVDLSRFKIGDEELPGGIEGMLRFPADAHIPGRGVLVVANRATDFAARYGFLPDYEMRASHPDVPTLDKYAAWASGNVVLLNTSDEVVLIDGKDRMVDAVSWGASTIAFDPPAPDVDAGCSLERVPADHDSDSATDWVEQPLPNPGEISPHVQTPTPTPTLSVSPTASGTITPSPLPSDGPLLISEVLYDPAEGEPAGEWVELYNPGVRAIALAGYKLGDEEAQGGGEGMYRFPDSADLASGDVLVIAHEAQRFLAVYGFSPDYEFIDSLPNVPDMIKYPAWASGAVSLSNVGDEVLLLDGGDRPVDVLSWGTSTIAFDPPAPDVPESHSLERLPADRDTDTAGDWADRDVPAPGVVDLVPPAPTHTPAPTDTLTPVSTPSQTPTHTPSPTPSLTITPGGTSTPTPSGTIGPGASPLISEVFYDTPGTDSQEEWLEIYNSTADLLDLSEFKLGDEETAGGGEGMFKFPPGAVLAQGEKVVVALQSFGFTALYGFPPDFEINGSDPAVPNMVPYTPWGTGTLVLSNSGDEILLLDHTDSPVDVVVYENGTFPGVVAHPGVSTGHSLERTPPDQDTDDCSVDFHDREVPSPGS